MNIQKQFIRFKRAAREKEPQKLSNNNNTHHTKGTHSVLYLRHTHPQLILQRGPMKCNYF